jgi:histidyl-tRNA synthetase
LLHVIVPLTEQQKMLALTLSHELQKHACATAVYLQQAGFDEHLQQARLMGARYVLAIGPDEQVNGMILINDLGKRTCVSVAHEDILTFLGVQRSAN